MPEKPTPSDIAAENHTMLRTLLDSQGRQEKVNADLYGQVDSTRREFMGGLEKLNASFTNGLERVHSRLDTTQTEFSKSGKLTASQVGTLAALCAIIGGMVTAYVSVRVDPVAHIADQAWERAEHIGGMLTEERVKQAEFNGRMNERSRWTMTPKRLLGGALSGEAEQ